MIYRAILLALLSGLVSAVAQAQPVWQSSQTAVGAGGTSATVAKPASTASGDLLVIGLMFEKGSSETITPPVGWSLIRRTDNGNDIGMATYYKVAGASEPANYSFAFTQGSKWAIGISRITGANGAAPIDVSGGQAGGSGTSVTAPSVTTTVGNTLVLAFYTNKKNATYAPAGTTTERYDAPNNTEGIPSNMMATFVQAASGATGNRTATASEAERWVAQQIALWPSDVQITGPTYASGPGTNGYNNPGNAVGADEATCATAFGGAGTSGFWNFGITVPATHIVTGVKVEIKASASAGGPVGPTINIGKDETTLGTEKPITTLTSQACGPGQLVHSFGGPTDLWGLSLTPAEVNSPTFTVRIYAGTSPSHQIRINWIRVTVYHRPPAAAPGSFNAFETSTAPNAITGVIRTKVAGTAFGLDVTAISSGSQANGFTNAVRVDLIGNNTLGVPLDANNCPTSSTTLQTVSPNPTITNGRSTVSFAAVADSWRDVRVRVLYPAASPTVISCSTDNFAIRPASLSVAATDDTWDSAGTTRALNNIGASGGVVHKAGRNFTMRVTPAPATATNYNGNPTVGTLTCTLPATCATGTLTLGAFNGIGGGVRESTTATYSEAGAFNLTLVDDSYAAVDNADGTPADCTASGRYVCSSATAVGRFVPDHFAFTSPNTPQFRTFDTAACAGRSFTYVGQPFGYATRPAATVEARSAGGTITTNYRGALFKLLAANLSQSYSMAGKTINPTLQTAVLSAVGDGTATYTAHANDKIAFNRDPATADAPFNAAIALTWVAEDSSDNIAGQGIITTSPSFVFSAIAFDAGTEFRYGRLRLANANGSQLANLPVLMDLQYRNSVGAFITNAADSCTSIASQAVSMTFAPNLVPSPNCKTLLSGGGQFSSGRRTLVLSAPGNGNQGAATLTVNLNGAGATTTCTVAGVPAAAQNAAQPWLQGNWTTPTFTQDASARATFGAFPGAGEVIFIRENF